MCSKLMLAIAFVLPLGFASELGVVASASAATSSASASAASGGQLHGDDDDQEAKPKFPMTAADFRQLVDTRTAKARKRMAECAATLPADEAASLRASFDAGTVKINEEVEKATADGTVTKGEAKKVRDTARSVHDDPKACKRDSK